MNNHQIKIIKVFESPIANVWDAWTNPDSLREWLSPEGMTNPEVTCNFVVGGKYRIVMEGQNMPDPSHNGTVTVGGEYLVIQKPHQLIFTWLWENSPVDTHTTKIIILLKIVTAKKTKMTLIQTDFADDKMRQEHDLGWSSTFSKLEKFLKGGE